MDNKQILGRLYKDYTKKFLSKIIIAAFFSILVAGSTSSIAWLLDPAIEKIFVEKDDIVKQGDIIGTVGSSGRSTGPHLDIRLNWFNVRLDPATVLEMN